MELEEIFIDDFEDEDEEPRVYDGRLQFDGDRVVWLRLRRRAYPSQSSRRLIFDDHHPRRGRGVEGVKYRIQIRLPKRIMEERLKLFDYLLKSYGMKTVSNLGEFDRAVYEIGLRHIKEEAERQAKNIDV